MPDRDAEAVAARVRRSFARPSFTAHLGARLHRVEDGVVEVED